MAATTKTDVAQVLDLIKGMTIVEVADLVKMIEDEFGVTAVVPVAAGAGAVQATEGPAVEEKTSFTVILKSGGSNKIPVIKEVRSIIGLGLKETKELVEAGNKPIKENVTKKEAEEIKKKLEELGASVELQ